MINDDIIIMSGNITYAELNRKQMLLSNEMELIIEAVRTRRDLSQPIRGTTLLHFFAMSGMFFAEIEDETYKTTPVISDPTPKDTRGRTPMHICALSASWLRTDWLRKFGTKIDEPDENGDTPLFTAIKHGGVDLMIARGGGFSERLLSMGCSPINSSGETFEECVKQKFKGIELNSSWLASISKSQAILLSLGKDSDSRLIKTL